MSFTQDTWTRSAELYDAIIAHPFNAELAAGTLRMDRFQHYLLQDALYLIAYSRALSIIAARAEASADMVTFAARAREAVVVERALHESYFGSFGLTDAAIAAAEPSPACLMYNHFLVATAYGAPYEVAVAAVLPCFWVYWRVGNDIHRKAAADNPFQAWIDAYVDAAYGAAVNDVIAVADRIAETASPGVLDRMHAVFRRSTQLEWMFWDAAYRLEGWPIG